MNFETEVMIRIQQRALAGDFLYVQADQLTTEELVRLAASASSHGGRVTFQGLEKRGLADMFRIVRAGGRWMGRTSVRQVAEREEESCGGGMSSSLAPLTWTHEGQRQFPW